MHEIAACRRRTVGEQVTPGRTDDLGGEYTAVEPHIAL